MSLAAGFRLAFIAMVLNHDGELWCMKNSGDRVCERDRFIGTIHGVCKPDFERKEKKLLKNVKVPQSMSLKSCTKAKSGRTLYRGINTLNLK